MAVRFTFGTTSVVTRFQKYAVTFADSISCDLSHADAFGSKSKHVRRSGAPVTGSRVSSPTSSPPSIITGSTKICAISVRNAVRNS
jgi:hypothetical protein